MFSMQSLPPSMADQEKRRDGDPPPKRWTPILSTPKIAVLRRPVETAQDAVDEYRRALAAAKITPSMSRKENCLEFQPVRASGSNGPGGRTKAQNAPMEVRPLSRTDRVRGLTYHTLKVGRVHHRVYATQDEARRDLFAYIEGFYNSRRLHSATGYRSPADMERMAA
jgi:hypothetical protein